MRHLPADRRALSTWRRVAADIEAPAAGGDIEGAAIGLRMVLFLDASNAGRNEFGRCSRSVLVPRPTGPF
jgi:hypothetical protein